VVVQAVAVELVEQEAQGLPVKVLLVEMVRQLQEEVEVVEEPLKLELIT
jgi:hypothetical protein